MGRFWKRERRAVPTPVGVNRLKRRRGTKMLRRPHARGGEPPDVPECHISTVAVPTPVGVNRINLWWGVGHTSRPHAGGGHPTAPQHAP